MAKYGDTLLVPKHTQLMNKLRAMERLALEESLNRAAYAGAIAVEAQAKLNIQTLAHEIKHRRKYGKTGASGPGMVTGLIDTGFLANSVYTMGPDETDMQAAKTAAEQAAEDPDQVFLEGTKTPRKFTAVVTCGAEYARYQEMGTSKMEAHPFLEPAATQAEPQVIKNICAQLGHVVTAIANIGGGSPLKTKTKHIKLHSEGLYG